MPTVDRAGLPAVAAPPDPAFDACDASALAHALTAGTGAGDRGPAGAWAAAASSGLNAVALAAALRRGSWTPTRVVGVVEELARHCEDNGSLFAVNAHLWSCVHAVARFGSSEMHRRYLAPAVRGDVVLAHAVTEPGAGSDIARLETVAARDGDGWRLSGAKTLVTNAPVADAFLVLARVADAAGPFALTMFVVGSDAPGLRVMPAFETMGLRRATMSGVELHGCRVAADGVLGSAGSGFAVFSANITWERGVMAAALAGTMRRHVDHARELAAATSRGGHPLARSDRVTDALVDGRVAADAAHHLVRAWAVAQDGGDAPREAATAKLFATDAVERTASLLFELGGGRSYVHGSVTGDEYRDALAARFYGGGAHALRATIATGVGRA